MATKYEYYDSGDDQGAGFWADNWKGQTFTPETSHSITSVKLPLYKAGAPTGDITVSIRATDENGHPTDGDLCSGTISASTLTTSPASYEITFGSSYSLQASTKYGIVVRLAGGDASNRGIWRYNDEDATYSGGCKEQSSNAGSSWQSDSNDDFLFEDWGYSLEAKLLKEDGDKLLKEDSGAILLNLGILQKAIGGTLSFAGSVAKSVSKSFSGALTSSAILTKTTDKLHSGVLSFSGSVQKAISKFLAGALSPEGSVSKIALKLKYLSGTLSFGGSIVKGISKSASGVITFTGSVNKATSKIITGGLSFVGTLTAKLIEAGKRLKMWLFKRPYYDMAVETKPYRKVSVETREVKQ